MKKRGTKIYDARSAPAADCLHVDLSTDGQRDLAAKGVALTLANPRRIVRVARRVGRRSHVDWVVWGLASLPMSERRAASFVVEIARRIDGAVWVIAPHERSRRHDRILGHLRRFGCEPAPGSVSPS